MKSMTGFGKGNGKTADYQIEIEIKSVNQRFMDLQLRMPKQLNDLEALIRQEVKKVLQRGRVELYLTLNEKNAAHKEVIVQWDLLVPFLKQVEEEAAQRLDIKELSKKNLLEKLIVHEAFLDIREKQQEDTQLEQGVLDALSQALTAIDQSREIEGQGIYQVLKENQQQLLGKIMELQTFIAVYEADHRQRFEKKLTEYLGEQVDQERLLTEMAILLERGDIHEELDRMMIHLDSMTTLLEAKSPIGRELDFLIQEMNREVNTIGSKSSPIEIKNSVVQMKTIIEKIREQVQNIE
ncbi:YicC/YloC family endoribonuclease [Enterococcus gallinarum]|uniref:YicC/YloC family endoribonuclease n=1 Tax=Enterococcus gallinarum TaxID=1353 RepID=UPI000E3F73F6|nr:YicC/YloC family endoribonuclease [Enterococcus gallinarum]MDT2729595.1 YicC family protein [Enterococcus gallinarum]RGC44556.1 YicC family protein [Enterococcus gallinarum]